MRSRSNWNLEVLVIEGREKPEYPEISQSKRANQPQTQPTYARIRNRATLVGDDCSHYCAALALENTFNLWRMRIIAQQHGLRSRTRHPRNDSTFLIVWGQTWRFGLQRNVWSENYI